MNQYLVAKQLQNGDTQLERSYRQNDTTFMDWFVVGIHLLCGKSNNCGKSNKPLQKSHHMYFSSIFVTCKWHHQAASIFFQPFNQKESALLVARELTIDTLLLDSHHPAARTSMAACPYQSGPPGHPHRSPVKRSNDSRRKNHLGEATQAVN